MPRKGKGKPGLAWALQKGSSLTSQQAEQRDWRGEAAEVSREAHTHGVTLSLLPAPRQMWLLEAEGLHNIPLGQLGGGRLLGSPQVTLHGFQE